MGPFTMTVMIVAIIGLVRIVQAKHGVHRRGIVDQIAQFTPPAADAADAEQLRRDLARLKDRVAVLERIVTDGDRSRGLALEREIDALRDERGMGR